MPAVVFTGNMIIGQNPNRGLRPAFSAFALYASVGLAICLVAGRPILHTFVHTAIIFAILLVSTALLAVVLAIAFAYASVIAARYSLPVADRLEGRTAKMVVDQEETS